MTFFDRLRRVAALLADPKVAKLPRLAVLLAAVYLVSPVDLFPDFLVPVVGYLDDLLVIWAAVKWLLKSAPAASSLAPADPKESGS